MGKARSLGISVPELLVKYDFGDETAVLINKESLSLDVDFILPSYIKGMSEFVSDERMQCSSIRRTVSADLW